MVLTSKCKAKTNLIITSWYFSQHSKQNQLWLYSEYTVKFYWHSFFPVKAAKNDIDTESYRPIYSGELDCDPFVPMSFLGFGQCGQHTRPSGCYSNWLHVLLLLRCFKACLREQAHCISDWQTGYCRWNAELLKLNKVLSLKAVCVALCE